MVSRVADVMSPALRFFYCGGRRQRRLTRCEAALHDAQRLYTLQRRLTRAYGTLHGATRPYTAAPAALTRAYGTFLGGVAATYVCLGPSTCGGGG